MSPGIYYATVPSKTYIPTPVTIGDQVWDSKNLDTSYYRDGSPIQYGITSPTSTVGAYFWYDGLQPNGLTYGKLYNWWAVNDSRNIAPAGWRVATSADWTILTDFLGGDSVAGGKLKQTGTTLWTSPNTGATNSSGFTALPGGRLNTANSSFENIFLNAYFRTSSSTDIKRLGYNSTFVTTTAMNNFSFHSVRLIKITVDLTTTAATPITGATSSSLSTGGNISNLNNFTLTEWGVCYSTSTNPTRSNDIAAGSGAGGTGDFTSTMSGLTANTSYYIRAYVVTTTGETFYGQEVIGFAVGTSTITTDSVTATSGTTATAVGTITSSNTNNITQSGFCWGLSINPTIDLPTKTTNGFNTGIAPPNRSCGSGLITGLSPSTQYNVRAYVTTTADTTYGANLTVTTPSAITPLHVFSMRKYIVEYAGYAMTVRRGTGGSIVTANVSFNSSGWVGLDSAIFPVSGTTTSTTLGGFAGIAGSIGPIDSPANQTIYVSKWYDQSGNSKDVIQASNTTSQPTIITAGVLNIINSRPYIKFASASGTYLSLIDSTNSIPLNNLTSFSVISNSVTANQVPYALNNGDVSAFRYYNPFIFSTTDNIAYGSGFGSSFGANTPSVVKLYNLVTTPTGFSAWRNTTAITPVVRTNTGKVAYISIGRSGAATSNYLTGSIQEILCFNGALPDREGTESEIISTYNI